MQACILKGSALEPRGREQHALLRAYAAYLVMKHLNHVAFDSTLLLFALDQYQEIAAERLESGRHIDRVPAVQANNWFQVTNREFFEADALLLECRGDELLKRIGCEA